MKKIISILTLIALLLSSISVFAVDNENGIVIDDFEYNSAKYAISLSGKINGDMKGIPVTMMVFSPTGDILFAEQTMSDINDNTYSFEEVCLPLDMSNGDYTVEVSEIFYGTSERKTAPYKGIYDTFIAVKAIYESIFTQNPEISFPSILDSRNNESDTYGNILGMDKELFTNLSADAQGYALNHIKSFNDEYEIPEILQGNETIIQDTADKLKQAFDDSIPIGKYHDITSAELLESWLLNYYNTYNFGVDDSATDSNESLLMAEYTNQKSNSVFQERVIGTKGLTTLKAIRDSIHENALISVIKTEYYTQAQRVVEAFPALFPIDEDDMDELNPTEQGEIYNQLKPLSFADCADVAKKIDDLVDAKIKSKNENDDNDDDNDSEGGNGSSWGGNSGGGSYSVNLIPPVVQPEETQKSAFNDLGSVNWAEKEINYLAEKKIINGKAENKFYPKDNITRAEFVKILTLSMGVNIENMVYDDVSFADVQEWDWYYPYVVYCKKTGIVNGDDKNQFRPNDKITREDIAVIIYRAVFEKDANSPYAPEFNDNSSISAYAYDAIGCLNYNGIVKGNQDNCFEAKNNSTRAEAAVMIYRTFFE